MHLFISNQYKHSVDVHLLLQSIMSNINMEPNISVGVITRWSVGSPGILLGTRKNKISSPEVPRPSLEHVQPSIEIVPRVIIIFIYCNWVVTRWMWLFYM